MLVVFAGWRREDQKFKGTLDYKRVCLKNITMGGGNVGGGQQMGRKVNKF